jgi:hypothetical protein
MGHYTVLGDDVDLALAIALEIKTRLAAEARVRRAADAA